MASGTGYIRSAIFWFFMALFAAVVIALIGVIAACVVWVSWLLAGHLVDPYWHRVAATIGIWVILTSLGGAAGGGS